MIKILNVSKNYDQKEVLFDINWTLEKGNCYGLVGSNGSGKSTLLRLMSGVLEADSGIIEVDDKNVFDSDIAKRKIFFLADEPYFFAQSTIKDMKKFYKLFYPNFDDVVYNELLSDFKLNENTKINEFSKGMKRQVVLILALASKPEVLLLDEAFDGLDPLMRFKLRQYISKEIIDRQVIIIISSHNLRELEDICDSIVMIKENRLQFNHTTDEAKQIYHKYQMVFEENFNVENFSVLNPLNITGKDRIFTVILKGDMSTIDAQIKALNPLIYEHNPVTLEEIFIYEMEGNKNEGTV